MTDDKDKMPELMFIDKALNGFDVFTAARHKYCTKYIRADRCYSAEEVQPLIDAFDDIKNEFERLKKCVMARTNLSFIEQLKQAVYLDGVIAVIDTKSAKARANFKVKNASN